MSTSLRRPLLFPFTWPLSLFYGLVVAARNHLYEGRLQVKQLPSPVISVGNVTVGGSGKTPLVAWLAQRLLARGWPVAVLSRGYRRREQRPFTLVSDGRRELVDVDVAGDEPLELARSVQGLVVAVGADRYRAGLEVIRQWGRHLFILDDGFQHRRLFRDLDLVCLDAGESVADLRLLPAGRLREPLSSLTRAHALVWTRVRATRPREALASRVLRAIRSELPVFRGVSRLSSLERMAGPAGSREPETLHDKPLALMAGMARPDRFEEDLLEAGARIVSRTHRRDHHRWSPDEVATAMERARARGAEAVVTTGKDAVKLDFLRSTPLPLYRAVLETDIEETERFDHLLARISSLVEPRP